MTFDEVLTQIIELLRRDGRVSYRALKRRFGLDDDYLDDLKAEIIKAKRLAVDEEGEVLVWIGATPVQSSEFQVQSSPPPPTPSTQPSHVSRLTPHVSRAEAERRQITVLFCDLVGSTALSTQLDPEDYQALVQQYHQTCAAVIRRHDGYVAQPLGDGVLVYFGYPTAHEDDARRAIRTGLEITEAVHSIPLPQEVREFRTLQVRIGVHTGLVVVGEIGGGDKKELLALGETPNLAARIQGVAEPNTVLVSAATQRLVDRQFESQPFGTHLLKGFDSPIAVYHVQSERQQVSPLGGKETLTPLVGREQEIGLLLDRWEQTKEGRGQVILLSGEPGIGKSRLALTLKEHVANEGSLLYESRCSPYHQHSAFYPLIEVLQRTLLLTRQDTDEEKVAKLERVLALYGMQETLPLFAALLSLPAPSQYPPLNVSPQKHKERTLQALLQLMAAQAERQATVSVWEDVHWADPSSLEFLSLLIEQIPTTKLLLVLTFRPEFRSPWQPRSHISQLVLNRLGKKQVEAMIEQAAAGKHLSAEVIEQIRLKTDGVPLFVEEVTKSVIENVGAHGRALLQLAIPATLQEALLARLDRLSTARQVAQLGATLGREFSHELLQAVSPLNETDLHAALTKLVEAEILYQRGVGEQARYFFKHALIQDTAYQSLLKSTRQQYHQQIARVLEERFPDMKENQPELLAHHYTEANLIEQAIPYWQQAGQRATQRSAYLEAVAHLTKGLEVLKSLPDTPERTRQELTLQLALGASLQAVKGFASPEVERVYTRAQELCRQGGETAQLFPALWGLWFFYLARAEIQTARETGEQLLTLAQSVQDADLLLETHTALGATLFHLGEFVLAREHLEQGIALYESQKHHSHAFIYGTDPGVNCRIWITLVLWFLGYPSQALKRSSEAITLARETSHAFSLGFALDTVAWIRRLRREGQATQQQAETLMTFANEQGFTLLLSEATMFRGWALSEQGQEEEGISQVRQGLAAQPAMETVCVRPHFLALLAEACRKVMLIKEGLALLDEALTTTYRNVGRFYEAELYRLKGELTLQQNRERAAGNGQQEKDTDPRPPIPDPQSEAEACFLKALEVSRKQQAKSLELRASTSLARLWQSQGKRAEAHKLLSEIYNWFTEGFDTKDLQEAKALIEELSD